MNRQIIIGFEKGASYKSELGSFIGLAKSRPEALKLANEARKKKNSKIDYCVIFQGKKPAKIIRESQENIIVSIADVMKQEAQAKAKAEEEAEK